MASRNYPRGKSLGKTKRHYVWCSFHSTVARLDWWERTTKTLPKRARCPECNKLFRTRTMSDGSQIALIPPHKKWVK